eukprot:CAMPEP_0206390230 /NCGR_PEP_ID=MMETSP0294-20121207/18472_1 /ASSEMBLY_ACC=CAM_ASM_000327 /TAXON_ID=39354 /ORGANISM="Heterosigma akashiwo, Strain CCMP2393" /LENGTH=83 /DNA_ID=CAMNT_0053842543 /DNA_START=92 /DNA_END=344 /DNA_ORIENTATION=+
MPAASAAPTGTPRSAGGVPKTVPLAARRSPPPRSAEKYPHAAAAPALAHRVPGPRRAGLLRQVRRPPPLGGGGAAVPGSPSSR